MKLADVLCKECVVAGAKYADKAEVLEAIVDISCKSRILEGVDRREILEALQARESLGSTGVGKAVAIPHCRLKSVKEFVLGVISVPSGVDFDALDGKKVKLIVFIIAPEIDSNKHIRLLSSISQRLLAPKAVEGILDETTPEGLYNTFLQDTDMELNGSKMIVKSMVHVFIGKEELFRDILQIMTSIENSSLFVINAEKVSAYLSKMPLFASFWTEEPSTFGSIIVAVIDKKLINEAIRRIESISGDLSKSNDVMVTVQDTSFVSGSLST